MTLRLRICAVLGVYLAVNALFVVVLLWAYGVLVPWVVAGSIVFLQHGTVEFDLLRLPVSWPTAAVLVAGFLLGQVYYGYRRLLSGTRHSGDADHEVANVVRRLAMGADVPEPGVRVVEDETPSCYTVGRFTDATIVLTTGLIERLDPDELEAVLAHEIAHVANRDVTLMTITTLFVEIADQAYQAARLVRRAVSNPKELSGRGRLVLQWFLPLAALTYVFVSPILWVFPTIATWATRTLSHAREFAADDAAARLTGDPLALATGLLSLSEATEPPETDLRAARIRALCVVPAEPVSGTQAQSVPSSGEPAEDAQRREQVTAWLDGATPSTPSTPSTTQAPSTPSDTHPAVEERVRRLRDLAAELEGSA